MTDSAGKAGGANAAGSEQDFNADASKSRQNYDQQWGDKWSGGKDDRWVEGNVNWDTFELPGLTGMVAMPEANPSQVDTVAGLWRSNGAAITQGAEDLSQSLTSLMNYWQGAAAQQAADSVTASASWISAVGDTAAKVADQIENAGGALRAAQAAMPGQPTNPFWNSYNSAADGSAAGAAGGPVGAAAGAMSGGLTSMYGASANQNADKQQAVQTMQRFEQAAMSIDTSTPQFQPPPSWGPANGTSGGRRMSPINVSGPGSGTVVTSNSGPGNGGSTVPSFADSPVGRWNALTGGGAGGPGSLGGLGDGTGSAGAGAGGGGALGLFGGFGGGLGSETDAERRAAAGTSGSGVGSGVSGGAVASASPDDPAMAGRIAGGAPGSGGLMEEVDGPMMGGGMMGGGMLGGQGARGGAEGEHKRRIPYEEDPFLTGLKAAPRVIGLSGIGEDTEK